MKSYNILFSLLLFVFCQVLFGQSQMELNFESKAKYEKADIELNKSYKQLMNALNPKLKKQLVETQRIWIKFRDATCNFEEAEFEGGSIQPLIYFNCLEKQTKFRAEDLKQIMSNYN